MDTDVIEIIKQREICFSKLHPDPRQAHSAVELLGGVDGIEEVTAITQYCVRIHYDVRILTLKVLEEALVESGFHLDNNLLIKLKRALHHYTEETQRANLGVDAGDQNQVTKHVFIKRYQRRQHGCRDCRPDHWRKYL